MVMNAKLNQGDILKIERISRPVLVVSKDYFNMSGEVVGCPIYEDDKSGPLHIYIRTDSLDGYVQCEKLALLDLNVRTYSKVDRISMPDVIDITDAIQSIFDYI